MPIVRVELFPGRAPDIKAAIAKEITQVLQTVAGVPPQDTTVMFIEVAPSDWAVAGKPFAPGPLKE
ncbi:4-oxalocrotonate tautomerase family protein [Mesorhizobium sp. BAC0120]|uniref:tautomerase family protein n=1 Tax=Mesorhizobium sp. BAC0120 TaxID=3090670 RepID=UPI00298C9BF2|nr:4-oxalocrotonate tautomerase family protein [Mesorhizobium sp. BAC0120]MDW6023332.1 4-oxalocrotonate tautomerase family protein [Mesorhizobium sp. BAC0120]